MARVAFPRLDWISVALIYPLVVVVSEQLTPVGQGADRPKAKHKKDEEADKVHENRQPAAHVREGEAGVG